MKQRKTHSADFCVIQAAAAAYRYPAGRRTCEPTGSTCIGEA